MNAKDFDKIVGARLNWCEKTLCAKGDEYARDGDRLWNFKAAGRKRNQHPAQALAGMEVKHDVSVDDIIDGLARGIVPPKELVAEKIGDSINYLLLLEWLIEEERQMREECPVVDAEFEPWQAAISEHEAQVRAQVATAAQAKDTARDAMATSAQGREVMNALASSCGYIIPQVEDGDDDPAVVHIVPDKTPMATLPSGCLGRLCGRGGDDDEWLPCPEDAL